MELQTSIRELIDPWTRIGYTEEIKPNLFTGKDEPAIKVVFVYGGRIQSRYMNKSSVHGDSILYCRVWYSIDLELVKLDDSDLIKQLSV